MHDAAATVGFDRTRILDAANRARAKKKFRRAIALYRWVLAIEPRNAELHAKLAPLLAETNQPFDAWVSFRAVAKACSRLGQDDKALAVYCEAGRYLPREVEVWWSIARLQRKAGRDSEAIEVLIEGSRQFRPTWARPQAIYLLRRARELDPWNFDVVIELARHLAATEQRDEARILLANLASRTDAHRLRRVRAAQLRVTPNLRQLWLWLRAASLASKGAASKDSAADKPTPSPPATSIRVSNPAGPPARVVPLRSGRVAGR